ADMRRAGFRRVLFFGHFSVLCYLLLLAYVAMHDRHEIEWPVEVVKVVILYLANLYLAFAARLADAVDVARRTARAAQTTFLANVSHELRTRLNGVIGGTRRLASTDLSPAQRHHVSMVRESGEAVLGLVAEVLEFATLA